MARRRSNNGWGKNWERRSRKISRTKAGKGRDRVAAETLPAIRGRWKPPQERQAARANG